MCVVVSAVQTPVFHLRLRPNYSSELSGVTTMGSDRENQGASNLNGPNGGPQV